MEKQQSDSAQSKAGTSSINADPDSDAEDGRINWQAAAWVDGVRTTSSNAFTGLEGMELHIERQGPVTLVVSLVIEGSGEVRIRRDHSEVVDPGPISIDSSRSGAVSFTFVDSGTGKFSCDTYKVEWRSPSGEQLTVRKGSVSAYYRFDVKNSDGLSCA